MGQGLRGLLGSETPKRMLPRTVALLCAAGALVSCDQQFDVNEFISAGDGARCRACTAGQHDLTTVLVVRSC